MQVLIDNAHILLVAFGLTLKLLVVAGALSLVWGTILASMRVGAVGVMRHAATGYISIFRNTPLFVLLLLVFFGLPKLGVNFGAFGMNVLALTVYTSGFVCEAIRSGVNSVPLGQAEAARSVGLTFGQSMGNVILPQAVRAVVPPLASVLIALTKNTSLASIFGLLEATARMQELLKDHPGELWWIFLGIALGYVLIVEIISFGASQLERRWRIA
jgi:glutamate transport system permease protein